MKVNNSTKAMLLAVAATAFSSCNSEDYLFENDANQNSIDFTTYLKATSRATVIDNSAIKKGGFKVLAYNTKSDDFAATTADPNFMANTSVKWSEDNNAWSYSPVQYWPTDNSKISFFAYAPANKNTWGENDSREASNPRINATTIQYNVVENVTNSKNIDKSQTFDLVSAKKLNCNRSNTTKVNLDFNHATSRIDVKLKIKDTSVNEKATVYVTGMTFSGNKFYTAGTYNFNTELWSDTKSAGSTEYSLENLLNLEKKNEISAKGYTVDTKGYKGIFKNETNSDATDADLSKKDYFFVIPNEESGVDAQEGDFLVKFDYTIVATAANNEKYNVVSSKTFDLNTVFTKGKAYCLNFEFDLTTNEIIFDGINVEVWDNYTTSGTEVEGNTEKDSSDNNTTVDKTEDSDKANTFTHYYLYGSYNDTENWSDTQKLTKQSDGSYTVSLEKFKGKFIIGTSSNNADLYGTSTSYTSFEAGQEYSVTKGYGTSLASDVAYKDVTITFTPSTDGTTATVKFEGTEDK